MDEKEIKEELKGEIIEEKAEENSKETEAEINEAAETEEKDNTEGDTASDEFGDDVVVSKARPLPIYGKGIYFVLLILILTIAAVVLGHMNMFKSGIPSAKWLRYTYIFLGLLVGFFGVSLYSNAINEEEMVFNLRMGNLITTGVYSKTRNPVYSGIILMSTAVLFFSGNVYMYVLPFIEVFILFVWIAPYEDNMLRERFGEEYDEYRKKTHFILPNKKTDIK